MFPGVLKECLPVLAGLPSFKPVLFRGMRDARLCSGADAADAVDNSSFEAPNLSLCMGMYD
jgi:hypothetical protein